MWQVAQTSSVPQHNSVVTALGVRCRSSQISPTLLLYTSSWLPQYVARLHAEKLKRYLYQAHKAAGGALGTKAFNMRLCPEEVSNSLTGFRHNAVSPIGIATRDMPIVLSDRCASAVMLGQQQAQATSNLPCVPVRVPLRTMSA